MKSFMQKLLVTTLSLGVASLVVSGIRVDSFLVLIVAAFVFNLLHQTVRPLLVFLTLPITIVTLGLFLLLLNALLLGVTAWLLPGFAIDSLGAAILGWLIVALTSWISNSKIKKDNRKDA